MKKLLLPFLTCVGIAASAQNALLQNPTTGNIPTTGINNLCMVSNGTQVVLIAAGTDTIYAIDITDKNAAEANANLITEIPNFITAKLNPVTGQNDIQVLDMEVNPISHSVYVLASSANGRYIVKVKNNGADISLVNLNNVSYSKLTWGGQMSVNDMAFGNNNLYVTSGSFQLDGSIGWMAPPFANNATFTKRATTMFKSNWGNQYTTTAPLETLAFGKIDNKNRLMGVTTCAPGFSIDAATLQGAGVMQVTEDFNVQFGTSKRVAFMNHDNSTFLFDLHDGNLYRIGKKYLDGSQVTANNHNGNADELRDVMGNVPASFAATEMKQMNTAIQYDMMAKWDEYRLLLLESGNTGKLILSKMSIENPPAPTGINSVQSASFELYPNPAKGEFMVKLPEGKSKAVVNIVSVNGSVVKTQIINGNTTHVNIQGIAPGLYNVAIQLEGEQAVSKKLTIQ